MKPYSFLAILLSFTLLISACGPAALPPIVPVHGSTLPSATPEMPATRPPEPSISPTPFQPEPPTATVLPSETPTPLPTFTPTASPTPLPTLTPTWAVMPAGTALVPILLYHHISEITPASRYYVSPQDFRTQMQALHDWGYTTITPTYLLSVLTQGGPLPEHPVIITFDDGHMDVYDNAFPVMKEFGFVGTFYIVSNWLGARDFVGVEQLTDMIQAGWEIGSHSKTHSDLSANHGAMSEEARQSKLDLEEALGVPVNTLAYPFGVIDDFVVEKTVKYGYEGAMGLGTSNQHTSNNLYYLNRREVHGDQDLAAFAALLPWSNPAPTPAPTVVP